MVSLAELWLPILVAAVVLQIVSTILHMALPFWHQADYFKPDDDRSLMDGLRPLRPGLYMVPRMPDKATPEQREEWSKGPSAIMYVRNPSVFSFGKAIGGYFVYCLVSAIFVAYVAGQTLPRGTEYLRVFQIAGAVGTVFWAFGNNVSDAIWYGKPWRTTIKYAIDGLIYGCLMGGVFGWLWPS